LVRGCRETAFNFFTNREIVEWLNRESKLLLTLQKFINVKNMAPKIKKQIVLRVMYVLIAIIVIASVIAYFVLVKDREWAAFFVACCGGLLVVNLIIIIIFVQKNFK